MKIKYNDLVKLDTATKKRIFKYKAELELIEGRRIPLGEVVRRMSLGDDILPRLKLGSKQKKYYGK